MKKALVVLLMLVTAFAAFAQPDEETASASTEKTLKDTVRIGLSQILDDVVTCNNNTGNLHFLYNLYMDSLLGKESTLSTDFVPRLAESWEVSADSLTYTFHLRKDVYFSNGEKMTSADVVWSLETSKTYSAQTSKFDSVESITATDDYTVVIKMKSVEAELLTYMSSLSTCSIHCKKAVEADPTNGWLIGTGAYVVVENIAKDHTLFQKNKNYWGGSDKVVTEYIEVVYISEATSRSIAVQTGELDFAQNLNTNDLNSFLMYDNAEVEMVNTYGMAYAAINVSGKAPADEYLQNIHFRKALNYATDTASILALCYDGLGDTPNGVIPKGYAFYTEPDFNYSFDLEKAKEEMALSGVPEGITLLINCSSSTYPGLFEVLKDQWSKIGVNLEITTTGKASNLLYDIIIAKWTPSNLQGMMVAMWTENSSNRTKDFSNQDLVAPCSAVTDVAERTARYHKLQEAAIANACQIPLVMLYVPYGVNVNLENYTIDPCFAYSDFRFVACYN